MKNLTEFALKSKYAEVKKLRSNLEDMKNLINWNKFLKFFPKKEVGPGRPNYNKILMIKILFLQACYSISDEELEFQIHDRLSFQQFLDFPEQIPDYSTIWRFREELSGGNKLDKIWSEVQRQIDIRNIQIQEGVIQDARFVQADPGKTRSGMDERGAAAKTSRSKDGTWTKKNGKSYFGFKLHTKVQCGSKIIKEVAVTTAKVHDSNIDLTGSNDVVYRDKAYTGVKTKAKGNGSMKRGKLSPKEKLRNKRIKKKRNPGEHPYGTMDRSFKAGRTKLTTVVRVFVQQLFVCIAYNVHRLRFLTS